MNCSKLHGEFRKKIRVTTNDPANPMVELLCKGHILDPVKLDPPYLNFGRIMRQPFPVTHSIMITPGDAGPLDIKLVPPDTRGLKAVLHKSSAGALYELEVTVTPPFDSERLSASLILETGFEPAPRVEIPIRAALRPRASAHPRRIRIPADRKPDWRRAVDLIWNDGVERKVLGASIDDPDLTVEVEERKGRQVLVLSVPGKTTPGSARRNITLETDDPKAPKIKVLLTVTKLGR